MLCTFLCSYLLGNGFFPMFGLGRVCTSLVHGDLWGQCPYKQTSVFGGVGAQPTSADFVTNGC